MLEFPKGAIKNPVLILLEQSLRTHGGPPQIDIQLQHLTGKLGLLPTKPPGEKKMVLACTHTHQVLYLMSVVSCLLLLLHPAACADIDSV